MSEVKKKPVLEIWKPVLNYEELYEVSDLGRVRRIKATPIGTEPPIGWVNDEVGRVVRYLSIKTIGRDYEYVCLSKDGKAKNRYVHLLMLEAFVGPRPGEKYKIEGRHLDGNSTNNHLSNLKWGTKKENSLDTIKHRRTNRSLSDETVLAIRKLYKENIGVHKIKQLFNLRSEAHVYQIVKNRTYANVIEPMESNPNLITEIITNHINGNKQIRSYSPNFYRVIPGIRGITWAIMSNENKHIATVFDYATAKLIAQRLNS